MAHTSGPWWAEFGEEAGYDTLTGAWLIRGPERDEAKGGDDPVAVLDLANYGSAFYRDPDYETAEANAHLIAAAPDLLYALKALLELGGDDDRRILAETAIAKAEGKPT